VNRVGRVLMTADTLGGVLQYAVELSLGLAGQGIQVVLATMGGPLPADLKAALESQRLVRVFESAFKLEWMDEPWDDVDRAGRWLLDLTRRVQPDLVHVNGYTHAALPFDRPVVSVAHSCVCSWWRAVRGGAAPPYFDEYRARVTSGLKTAHAVVAPSQAMSTSLQSEYGKPRLVEVIHNGRNAGDFIPSAKEPFVLSLGRIWDEGKNLALLERAAPTIPWPVVIAGASGVAPRQEDHSSFHNARYLGPLGSGAVRRMLSKAAIYALPARYEPFGLSVLEAALSGAALVLGDIPSFRELWEDAALYVDTEDASQLSHAICDLIESPARQVEMGRRARARAQRFSSEAMTLRYSSLYESLVSEESRVSTSPGDLCA
jgi:glycosyltransferase involved in cell wall biosynthesis